MSCTAAEETREYTSTFIDILGPVDVRFWPTAYGTGANGPRPNTFHLGSWYSLITCKMMALPMLLKGDHDGGGLSSFTLFSKEPHPDAPCDDGIAACGVKHAESCMLR